MFIDSVSLTEFLPKSSGNGAWLAGIGPVLCSLGERNGLSSLTGGGGWGGAELGVRSEVDTARFCQT